ncbi:MAG: NVEALA domain-containing protein [Muribaculaceae bacterium]|nr:NVEALA domain-containing protein [Muribaculaceae bacterium]
MRKKILFSTAAVAVMSVASFAAITSSNQSRELSDLELANIEALTNEEGGSFNCK